jgi:hypothetical protein
VPNESFAKLAQMRKCIDTPRPAQAVYDECISISGWIFAEAREPSACRVQAWLEGIPIVETRLLFARADVSDFLSLPRDFPMAFRFLTRAVQPNGVSREATIEVTASWDGDAAEYSIGKVSVRLVSAGLKKQRFGKVVFPMQSLVLHRENIYGSGPPVLEPGPEMLRLILDYLSAGSLVLDVGCGAGAYASGLAAARKFPPPRRAP